MEPTRPLADATPELPAELLAAHRAEMIALLAPGVTHDLNNALGAMAALGQLLEADERLPVDVRRDAASLRQESERARAVVTNLLEFARPRPAEHLPADLLDLLRRTIELLSHSLAAARVDVRLSVPDELPGVEIGPADLQQALLAVLHDAIVAVRAGGRPGTLPLTCSVIPWPSRAGSGVGVRVEVGCTVPRPPSADGERGLRVARAIAAAHRGELRSEGRPDGGRSLVLELPALTGTTVPAPTAEAGPSVMSGELRGVVLVVDDEPSMRAFLQRALERAGHEVTTVGSGAAAFGALRDLTYDVLLIDHRMPGLDGVETYRRAVDQRPELARRAVLMSGDAMDPVLRDFAADRGLAVLAKPFEVEALRRVVADVLARDAQPGLG